jgi:pilus assembly protein Flp/PilA
MQKRGLRAFIADESGTTAMEYGLLAAVLALGLILTFTAFGDSLKNLFGMSESGVGNRLTEAQGKLG